MLISLYPILAYSYHLVYFCQLMENEEYEWLSLYTLLY
ncbi:hypothetical protein HBHAL_2155 [Halobacillus halophilus DSM 2266]|uniref:Uncharacterized protein n=1 Tax=Halobacillus halophilus (strain ATCC 35676 / DSM 2266 / JCM 20832 / KCTC 3685 / LMG 17431 / NBRC 102448 / NCIMB 2269) TaxID=866895 RepID=I0JK40_HALH3|nr:hypothetical protein HBHAL_2155 [Halobacillus halophilus DSM 2266]